MKLVIQRVKNASVEVEEKIVGEIEKGFLVLVGIKTGDTKEQADYLVKKVCNLRIFTDENNKMNLSIKDVNGNYYKVKFLAMTNDAGVRGNPTIQYAILN